MKQRIKKTYTVRQVGGFSMNTKMVDTYIPKAGDVGIFKIVMPFGNHVIGADGINVSIFEGDLIMAAFGSRYATSQYEAYVPNQPVHTCQLIGRGGVVGQIASVNPTFKMPPSQLELVGYATHEFGSVMNIINWDALATFTPTKPRRSKLILSIGSSMDSGKTTTAANLCAGLHNQGYRSAFIKLTGTAFPKDARYVYDRGADYACDFSLFGFPSTFLMPKSTLLDLFQSLVDHVTTLADPDIIVMEIADGILQRETAMLLHDLDFMRTVDNVIFSCGDSLSAPMGLDILKSMGIQPFALSGLFTASELLIREVESFCQTPVLRAAELVLGERPCALLQDWSVQKMAVEAASDQLLVAA